jgi:hypothetical protein
MEEAGFQSLSLDLRTKPGTKPAWRRAALAIQPRLERLSLARDRGEFMVFHKDEVEIGNSG